MASQLKVDTLTGVTTAGSISVTGEGNSTTTNLQQGLCKVWVNFNGTGTISIFDSFNTSGLVDIGTGHYQVNHSNNMNSGHYAQESITSRSTSASQVGCFTGNSSDSTRATTLRHEIDELAGSTYYDVDNVCSTVHGDLA